MMFFVMLIIVLIIFAVLMICGNWVDSGENTRWEPEEEEEVDTLRYRCSSSKIQGAITLNLKLQEKQKENQWEREKTGGEEPAV